MPIGTQFNDLKKKLESEKKFKQKDPIVPFTLHANEVTKKIIHALQSRKPKKRYYVTVPTHLFLLLKRTLPIVALDYLLSKASKI